MSQFDRRMKMWFFLCEFVHIIPIKKNLLKSVNANRWAGELVLWKIGGMRHSREVSMATLLVGPPPATGHQPALSHLRNLSGNTYLTQYLPGCDFQRGWEGKGSKLASEVMEKIYYDAKSKADGEWGWFVRTWRGKPSAIHLIKHYPGDKCHQNCLSYPLDSAVHPLNNWGLSGFLCCQTFFLATSLLVFCYVLVDNFDLSLLSDRGLPNSLHPFSYFVWDAYVLHGTCCWTVLQPGSNRNLGSCLSFISRYKCIHRFTL